MADLPDRVPPGQLRVSDADRERVAEVLRTAAADGRLDLHEVDERLNAAYGARTYADLEPLVRDLPGHSAEPARLSRPVVPAGSAPAKRMAVAILGGFVRKGPWPAPRRFSCLALLGGGTIDLREAQIPPEGMTIQAYTFMGGVHVIVPDDVHVEVTGIGIMGGFDHNASGAGDPGGPSVLVSGLALLGGVDVERKTRKKKRRPQIES